MTQTLTLHRIFAIAGLVTAFAVATPATAQRLSDDEVSRSLNELRNYKRKVLISELDLTKEQQKKFFEAYDAMDRELMDIGNEVRERERRTIANAEASETECTETARALFDQRRREGEVELSYFERFAEVLTPRQLLKLKAADRKIAMNLARYHGRHKAQRKAAK